jgi:Na+(H+)/acetate symporter ActP
MLGFLTTTLGAAATAGAAGAAAEEDKIDLDLAAIAEVGRAAALAPVVGFLLVDNTAIEIQSMNQIYTKKNIKNRRTGSDRLTWLIVIIQVVEEVVVTSVAPSVITARNDCRHRFLLHAHWLCSWSA